MPNTDWLPAREQDLVDLCLKWKAGLENPVNVAAFGWKQAEADEVSGKVNAFLTVRAAYMDNDSSKNRLVKDEVKEAAKQAMRNFAKLQAPAFSQGLADELAIIRFQR